MSLPSYLHTDLCLYFPVLNVKRAYPPSSLNSCIWSSRPNRQAPRIKITLFTYTDLYCSLFFSVSLTAPRVKDHPFYVHRPVLFCVLLCIANGTKGKRSPF